MKKNKLIGVASAAALGVMVTLQPINVLNLNANVASAATTTTTLTATEKALIAIIEAKVNDKASASKNISVTNARVSWEGLKKNNTEMKKNLAVIQKDGFFVVLNGNNTFKYNLKGRILFDSTVKEYSENEQSLISLIEEKLKYNSSKDYVYVNTFANIWSTAKKNPTTMKKLLVDVNNAKHFAVSNGNESYYIQYNLDGTIDKQNVKVLNLTETNIFKIVEEKRVAYGSSNSVQVGNTSYNWSYYKSETAQLKDVLNEINTKGSFTIFENRTDRSGSITFSKNGNVVSDNTISKAEQEKAVKQAEEQKTSKKVEEEKSVTKTTSSNVKDQSQKLEELSKSLDTVVVEAKKDDTANGKLTELQKELQNLNKATTEGKAADSKLDDRITSLEKEIASLKTQTDKNTKDIQVNAEELKEQKTLLEKLSETLTNLIASLDSLLNIFKSVFGIK